MLCQRTEGLALDPLFHVHVRLFVRDIFSLEVIQGLEKGPFGLSGRPIQSVQVVGTVVSATMKRYRGEDVFRRDQDYVEFLLDDGTGLLPCLYWPKQTVYEHDGVRLRKMVDLGLQRRAMASVLTLGSSVLALGHLQVFRTRDSANLWRLEASGLREVTGPSEEILHWLEVIRFHKEDLTKPFEPEPLEGMRVRCSCKLWAALHFCCCRDLARGCQESVMKQAILEWLVRKQADGRGMEGEASGSWTATYGDLKNGLAEELARDNLFTNGVSRGEEETRVNNDIFRTFQSTLQTLKREGVLDFSEDGSKLKLLAPPDTHRGPPKVI